MIKNALIKGTIILTIASLITRVLGIAQRIPLQRILGDGGMATYGIAYNIYGILLILATVGIPSALSKQIAEYHATNQFARADELFRAARDFALVAGLISAVVLYVFAPYYAVYISHDPEAILSIRAIAPALLLFPLISMMRGYFQGSQQMMPTGLSQVSEQILRVGMAVLLPILLLQSGYSHEVAVAGASFGAVAGSFGALAIMLYYFYREKKRSSRPVVQTGSPSRKEIYGQLLKTSIPISLASTAIPLIYFIDSSSVIALLKGEIGYEAAKNMLGILTGRAQSLAAIPPILTIALSSAVLPAIASSYFKGDVAGVKRTSSLALRLTLLIGTPFSFYLSASAVAINGFLFGNTDGSWVISALCVGSIFQMLMMTSMAILQGLGKMVQTMGFVFIGILVKAGLNLLFTPFLGIYGIILATTCGFITIWLLNQVLINKVAPLSLMGSRWKGFLFSSGLMFIVCITLALGLIELFPAEWPLWVTYGMTCVLTALISFPVYFGCLTWSQGITAEDLRYLPERVQRLLRVGKGRRTE